MSTPHHTPRGEHTSINTTDTEALFWRVHKFIHPLQNHKIWQIKALKWSRHFSPIDSMKARVNSPSCYCPEHLAIIFNDSRQKIVDEIEIFRGVAGLPAGSPWREVASVLVPTEQLKGNRFTHGHGHEDSKPKIFDQKKLRQKSWYSTGHAKQDEAKQAAVWCNLQQWADLTGLQRWWRVRLKKHVKCNQTHASSAKTKPLF